ncbi:NADH-quinone oxidoreductase subunit C [Microvirga sp. W0021]|uniref:NADH-quinone oxidoreductase subunit C n=1 Tax=Hohaiivirga grylli TaxID=3133970 RepID=A0ABV0BMH9_9HYPH
MDNSLKATDTAAALNELGKHIADSLGAKIVGFNVAVGELTVSAEAAEIINVLTFLRDDEHCKFVCLIDLCGVDYPNREKRFDVVYHLLSPALNQRVRVKIQSDENTPVPSIVAFTPAADWFEREAYDMYGIVFDGHPDLRRLLTDYGFEGFPLRKDFPLTGYVEVRYDEAQARVIYEPVKLPQEFRNFDAMSPWEGTDYVLPGDEKAQG